MNVVSREDEIREREIPRYADVCYLLARVRELEEALRTARHWHEQQDYEESLNVMDAALTPEEQT